MHNIEFAKALMQEQSMSTNCMTIQYPAMIGMELNKSSIFQLFHVHVNRFLSEGMCRVTSVYWLQLIWAVLSSAEVRLLAKPLSI